MYVTQKAIKAQALADHLAENPVDEEYEPLKTYFHDKEVSFVGEDISETYPGWRLFFEERQTIKLRVLEQYQNPVSTIPWQLNSDLISQTTWLNTKLVFLV